MSSRTVAAVFDADISRYVAKVMQMRKVTIETAHSISTAATKNRQDWDRLGNSALGAGTLMAGGLVAITTAAMQWESSFASVAKTVGGTEASLNALDGQLRGLARTMATSHEEIAQVAANAGALGVRSQDIARFTRTMLQLGEVTNLSAEDASTSIAQFMTVMGTAPEKVDRLGAVLVRLGNNGASTEAQIVELSQRLAGAARAIGMNEASVMGWASALASTGMNVEAAGTAMSRTFLTLDRIVTSGGSKLKAITDLMGTGWTQAFRDDASSAVEALIGKLGDLQASGGSITKVLDAMGIKSIYQTDAIRRLAGAQGMLKDQLGYANDEMEKGTALLISYQKRNQTAAAQAQIAWNGIKDAAIDAGQAMLPIVAKTAQQVAGMAKSWQDLPAPVKSVGIELAGVAAASLLMVGGGLKVVGVVSQLVASYKSLAVTAPRAAAGIRKAALAGTAVTVGLIALRAYGAALDDMYASWREKSADISKGLLEGGPTTLDLNKMFTLKGADASVLGSQGLRGVRDAFQRAFGDSLPDQMDNWFQDQVLGTSTRKVVVDQLAEVDKALSDLAGSGNAKAAAAGFQQIVAAASDAKVPLERVLPSLSQYRQQLDQIAEGLGLQGQISEQEYVDWMGGKIPAAVQKATASGGPLVDNLTAQQKGLAGVTSSAQGATKALADYHAKALALAGNELGVTMSFQSAFDPYKKGGMAKDGGFSFKTAKGQRNNQQINDIAAQANTYLQSLKDAGADTDKLDTATGKWRDKLRDAYIYGGKTKDEATALAATYVGLADEEAPTFAAPGLKVTTEEFRELRDVVAALPDIAETKVLAPGARPSKKEVDEFMDSVDGIPASTRSEIRTIAKLGGITAAKEALARLKGKDVPINPYLTDKTLIVHVHAVMTNLPKADGGVLVRSGNRLMEAFESGGFFKPTIGSQQPQIQTNRGPEGIVWAESGAGPWEAFISGHPAKVDRSRTITEITADRLGGDVVWRNADGGLRDYTQYSRSNSSAAQVVMYSTTNYPVAEPSSVARTRDLEHAVAIRRFP